MKRTGFQQGTPFGTTISRGAPQPSSPSRYSAVKMPTSGLPSYLPPNHAARKWPGASSTMVLAWCEGLGRWPRMIICSCTTASRYVPDRISLWFDW